MGGKENEIDPSLLKLERNIIPPEHQGRFKREKIRVKKNSLLVANVTGMHARGHIAAGHSRKMLRLLYHYVHALYFAQRLIFGLVSTVSLLN